MSDIGEMLRSARQKKHLTLAEAAEATRIKPQFLEALEDGEYGVIPGPAYVTGFLRNYARFLGLQPDDLVQEFFSLRPMPVPSVKAATRVLANGYERYNRRRVLWALLVVAAMFVAGYTIKQYNDSAAHAYSPQLNVTPANLGQQAPAHPARRASPTTVRVRLRAIAPAWAKVTVDGRQVYEGIMHTSRVGRVFVGHHTIFVMTLDGAHLRATVNGRYQGSLAGRPGMMVSEATPRGWQRVS